MSTEKDRKYNIVQIAPPQNVESGDYFYRVESPGKAMSKLDNVSAVVDITSIHRHKIDYMCEADILIIHHLCDPDVLPLLVARKEKGLLNIFEIWDDIEHIQPWNLTYHFWKNPENRSLICKLITLSDALQANNDTLLERFSRLNINKSVFPNNIYNRPDVLNKRTHDETVIGWGGSYGHLEDIRNIVPYLVPWLKDHHDVKMAIMGSEEIFKLFDDISSEQKIYRKPGSLNEYNNFLKSLDIGLAPLKNTEYNQCRSDVKFIEYAASGVVPLLQNLAPYRSANLPEKTMFLYDTPGELVSILDQLLSDKDLRGEVAKNAFEYVKQNRIEDQHAVNRLSFYCSLINEKIAVPRKTSGLFSNLSGHFPYKETDFERNLFNGLIYSETRNMFKEAYDCFNKAERLKPGSYLPNLFMFKCTDRPKDELKKALDKNPKSVKAYLLLGEYYNKEADYQSALNTYKEIIRISPEYNIPYLRSAEILKHLGMEEESAKLRSIAKNMNPLEQKSSIQAQKPVETRTGIESDQLFLVMPRGNNFGWGVCGKYLAKELSAFTEVKYVTDPFTSKDIGDELDYHLLQKLLVSQDELNSLISAKGRSEMLPITVIQAIEGINLRPWKVSINSKKRIGYTFFEEDRLPEASIKNAREYFDVVVAGSKWCENVLNDHGLHNTETIIQGIDPFIFNTNRNNKEYFKDQFVIFSGGKFELRKGQDLVIRAFKYLQDKYSDVILVTSWYNIWQHSLKTMEKSPYINLNVSGKNFIDFIKNLFEANKIPHNKVIALPPQANITFPKIYKNTDIGIFPNRCEGGTNLVLMEYMACGKPVIVSFSTGHKDILTENNSIPIKNMKSMTVKDGERVQAVWDDPDLEEIIEKLEWAYLNRDKIKIIGNKAGEDLSALTWNQTARSFYKLALEK